MFSVFGFVTLTSQSLSMIIIDQFIIHAGLRQKPIKICDYTIHFYKKNSHPAIVDKAGHHRKNKQMFLSMPKYCSKLDFIE